MVLFGNIFALLVQNLFNREEVCFENNQKFFMQVKLIEFVLADTEWRENSAHTHTQKKLLPQDWFMYMIYPLFIKIIIIELCVPDAIELFPSHIWFCVSRFRAQRRKNSTCFMTSILIFYRISLMYGIIMRNQMRVHIECR